MPDNTEFSAIPVNKCPWCEKDPVYTRYHDEEWGVPLSDDNRLFEFLVLEGFQAGLSWLSILKKRGNFRNAFDGFDPRKVALFDETKKVELLSDSGIVRNRLKIEAAINNAQKFLEIQDEFGSFSRYIWGFVDYKPIVNFWETLAQIPARTGLSDLISADMKKRGFKFAGSTIVYSHMQATGMVNDHLVSCFRHNWLSSRNFSFSGML